MNTFPFRLGTSSYIIPADNLPNAQYLAGKVKDIELILFEVDDGPNNLPSGEVIEELAKIAGQYDLTYTVHLPLDLKLGEDGSEQDQSLVKARRVIDCTRELDPWAYVLHLDGKSVRTSTDAGQIRRCAGSICAGARNCLGGTGCGFNTSSITLAFSASALATGSCTTLVLRLSAARCLRHILPVASTSGVSLS